MNPLADESGLSNGTKLRSRLARWFWDTVPGIVLILAVWEAVSWRWPKPLLPGIYSIAIRAYEVIFLSTGYGVCPLCGHVKQTVWRVLAGLAIAFEIPRLCGWQARWRWGGGRLSGAALRRVEVF